MADFDTKIEMKNTGIIPGSPFYSDDPFPCRSQKDNLGVTVFENAYNGQECPETISSRVR